MKEFDFLIVGAGLYGAVFASEAKKRGKTSLVIDRRSHSAGNIFTKNQDGINVHQYGPHIFHTNSRKLWEYVNNLVEFNRFTLSPVANFNGELFNLPFNMNTFYQLWKVKTPKEAREKIEEQVSKLKIGVPQNLEEQALVLVGTDIYEKLIKGYTEKQWGRKAVDLPSFIIRRLPVRFTYDNNYFNDRYQGIPIGGYTQLVNKLLEGTQVLLNTDFFAERSQLEEKSEKIVFTGMIDQFYDYRYGALQYRSLEFETESFQVKNFQGNAIMNYTDAKTPYTRVIEHKHFEFGEQEHTIVTKEYPKEWTKKDEPYYPVNDALNNELFKKYKLLTESQDKFIFGGRLADYKYYDMHQVIAAALKKVNQVFQEPAELELEVV